MMGLDDFSWTEDEPDQVAAQARPARPGEVANADPARVTPEQGAVTNPSAVPPAPPSWTPPRPEEAASQSGPVVAGDASGWVVSGGSEAAPAWNVGPLPVPEPAGAAGPGAHALRPEASDALTPDRLLRGRRTPPERGLRRFLYAASGGKVNLGDPPAVVHRKELEARVRAQLGVTTGFVPVFSRKGGVGKTTTTIALGMTLASLRHDRICAIDGNPDRGTLVDRLQRGTNATVFDVAAGLDSVANFSDMSRLVSRDQTRLDVVASDVDPYHARGFGAADYAAAADLLRRFYSVVLTDTGLDFTHEIQRAILDRADGIVVVAGGAFDEAKLAAETLDVIAAMGYGELASRAVVAIQSASQTPVKIDEIAAHFASRARAVVQIPRDQHLAEGSRLELGRLAAPTRLATLELAAHVVDGLHAPTLQTAATPAPTWGVTGR